MIKENNFGSNVPAKISLIAIYIYYSVDVNESWSAVACEGLRHLELKSGNLSVSGDVPHYGSLSSGPNYSGFF
jgi:hypothetical protein